MYVWTPTPEVSTVLYTHQCLYVQACVLTNNANTVTILDWKERAVPTSAYVVLKSNVKWKLLRETRKTQYQGNRREETEKKTPKHVSKQIYAKKCPSNGILGYRADEKNRFRCAVLRKGLAMSHTSLYRSS